MCVLGDCRNSPGFLTSREGSSLKIFFTKSQTEEPVAAPATVKKIMARFIHHRVFYELSARHRRSKELYSIKRSFTVGDIEVQGGPDISILVFDADDPSHSMAIVDPHAMQVYDDGAEGCFAVAFYSEDSSDFDVRYYLRDEGERGGPSDESRLERISLPQLFEYLQEITNAPTVEVGEPKK